MMPSAAAAAGRCQCCKHCVWAGSEDTVAVVLKDYPSPEVSEPLYRMGEKLTVIAQYDRRPLYISNMEFSNRTVQRSSHTKGQWLIPLYFL